MQPLHASTAMQCRAGATSPCSTSGASCAMHARRRQRRHAGAWQLHAHVADKWKLPPAGTPAETVAQWQAGDKELHGFLAASIPEALQHTGEGEGGGWVQAVVVGPQADACWWVVGRDYRELQGVQRGRGVPLRRPTDCKMAYLPT